MTHHRHSHHHYHNLTYWYECFVYFDDIKHQLKAPKWSLCTVFMIWRTTPKAAATNKTVPTLPKQHWQTKSAQISSTKFIIMSQLSKSTKIRQAIAIWLSFRHRFGVLVVDWSRFQIHNSQIRQQYSHVNTWLYAPKRRQALKGFYQRSPLYITSHFYQSLKHKAKPISNRHFT